MKKPEGTSGTLTSNSSLTLLITPEDVNTSDYIIYFLGN
jgi:hypothetical protein